MHKIWIAFKVFSLKTLVEFATLVVTDRIPIYYIPFTGYLSFTELNLRQLLCASKQ